MENHRPGQETALVNKQQPGNRATATASGQIAVDSKPLNDQLGCEEASGFQTLGGKPFYFFKRQGKVEANYAGVDIMLGYDEIPHFNCCSTATLNPRIHPNLVTFLSRKGDTWYYTEIGVSD